MAELVAKIEELTSLDPNLHWFCPRFGPDDDTCCFDEDVLDSLDTETEDEKKRRTSQLEEVRNRIGKVLDACIILAYDGGDAQPFQQKLEQALQIQLTRCDVCVREFHRSRGQLRDNLEGQYASDEVVQFMDKFDGMNISRINAGLDSATEMLLDLPPDQRKISAAGNVGMYAMFEALQCIPFLTRQDELRNHFDKPFQLSQTKKKIRLPSYCPGMTAFLYSNEPDRSTWAFKNFMGIKRPVTLAEFEYSVKPFLEQSLNRVHISYLEEAFLPRFWRATHAILEKLTKKVISEQLRSMDVSLYTTSLEHFQIDNTHFPDLIDSYRILLELSPEDFWNAMGVINPTAVLDTIFRSATLDRMLTITDEKEPLLLEQRFSWILPFVQSVKASNVVPPARVILEQLLKRFQDTKYPRYARRVTWETGIASLLEALKKLQVEIKGPSPVVANMLQLISRDYIQLILGELEGIEQKDEMRIDRTEGMCLNIVQVALALDVQSLSNDRVSLIRTKNIELELGVSGLDIWKMAMRSIKPGHAHLAVAITSGIKGLLPLEKLAKRQVEAATRPATFWNEALDRVLRYVVDDFLDRMQAFGPEQLAEMYQEQDGATGILAMLLNGNTQVHQPALDMLKTMSGEDSRRDSIMHVVKVFFQTTLIGINSAVHAVARARIFAPCSVMLKILSDLYSCLGDKSDGVLGSGRVLEQQELRALENFWQFTWKALQMIFEQTEPWSNLGYDKDVMQNFCRETMDFADSAFDKYSLLANVIKEASDGSDVRKKLLEHPKATFTVITKWLRLRDEYLVAKAVSLTGKVLLRLQEAGIEVQRDASESIENVLSGKTKTKLTMNQKAEIQTALEKNLGEALADTSDTDNLSLGPLKQTSLQGWASTGRDSSRSATPIDSKGVRKPGTIDVDAWTQAAAKTKRDAAEDAEFKKLMASTTSSADAFKRRQELQGRKVASPAIVKAPKPPSDDRKMNEFKLKRQREKEEAERRKAEALAKAKNLGAGSGVSGLGDIGKDHSLKGQNVMVSSDEDDSDESDDEDLDSELFGVKTKEKKKIRMPNVDPNGAIGLRPEQKKGPTRIQRTQRSLKDMRARLAPDLQPLHRVMLKWEFFHEGDYPPGANEHQFRAVSNTFLDPTTYQETFQPLLTLEAWQGMAKSREENSSKSYEIKVLNRTNVDAFIEFSSIISHQENRDLSLQEGDIILLSQAKKPLENAKAPHCLARIYRVKRQKAHLEIVYQVTPGTPLAPSLTTQALVNGVKVQSITPLEREYGALKGLQYYDLCQQILRARPSPSVHTSDKQAATYMDTYNLNRAQAAAVNAALENEGFSLIQGPPGSGKTKTIVAIVGGLLSQVLGSATGATRISVPGSKAVHGDAAPRKLLVCAPSNAAVDELVMRLKDGVKTKSGKHYPLNVVRIGRSDAINSQVLDVTMDELLAKRLGASGGNDPAARQRNQELFKEHEKISAELRDLYTQRDSGEVKGKEASVQDAIVAVRKRKQELSARIDNVKDQERNAGREAELNRKRAQQAVLDEAHVICATLSGSGHDMFQSLNIEFETVIIDEAAQCVEMSSLIPLKYGCVKCIMVGDPKQLPPTVFSKEAARFQYEQSLFVRMQNNFPGEIHLLDTQYRMHPDISLFPSRTFYDGLLKDGNGMAGLREQPWHKSALLAPYRFFDVAGQHQAAPKGHSLVNLAEIEVAMTLFNRVTSDFSNFDFKGQVGIITPYKSQLRALKERFAHRFGEQILDMVEFNTTDAFQGRESEIIIFSCVRASPAGGIGFLQDIRRMNVGLTRAKSSLWVLGNSESLARGQYWRKLVEDARARGCYTTGDIMGLLKKPSSAFTATRPRDQSMMDVPTQANKKNGTAIVRGEPDPSSRCASSNAGGTSNAPKAVQSNPKPSTSTSMDEGDSSKMEGISYRFEDRVASKKRPASETRRENARARVDGSDEDVEMGDTGSVSSLSRTESPSNLQGPHSRVSTPLSTTTTTAARATPPASTSTETNGKPKVAQVASGVRRKKAPVDPFLRRK